MMVNNQNRQPLHDLATIKRLVQEGKFELVNRRAQTKMKELGWSSSQMKALIQALDVARHYRGLAENMQSGVGFLDVDKYAIKFDEDALCEDQDRDGLEFFLKLALVDDDTSTAIVSFHLSGSP